MLVQGRSLEEWSRRFREGEDGRDEASSVFLALGEPAVGPLTSLLDPNETAITRAVAATTLWLLRGRAAGAEKVLERALRSDPDVVVRLRAAQALIGIVDGPHTEAVGYLREVAGSGDPQLAGWIKGEAQAILRDAGIHE